MAAWRKQSKSFRLFVSTVAAIGIGATLGFLPLASYGFSPGDALPVRSEIAVSGEPNLSNQGRILMTDILLTQLTPITWALDHLNPTVSIYPAAEVSGGASQSQLVQLQISQMTDSKTQAVLAAYNYLHLAYQKIPGAEIVDTTAKASRNLVPGDIIVGVNHVNVTTVGQAVASISHAGKSLVLTILSEGNQVGAPITHGLVVHKYRLGNRSVIGVGLASNFALRLLRPVRFDTGQIGGPSAGLAFTLGIMQALGALRISKGALFAATGTMDVVGNVGDVGGVKQKAIAVGRAGATLFLVPPPEYLAAKSAKEPGLKVVPVDTLTQAITYLTTHSFAQIISVKA